jgi:cytochrome P450 family 144
MGMDFDLSDPTLLLHHEVIADPRPLYDILRRRAPVWRLPGQNSYLVSDPGLIREVVGRTTEFSSNLISLLYRDTSGCPVAFDIAPLGDPLHVLATADPPNHTRHRKLLQPHFSPSAVGRLEPTIRRVVEQQLAPLLAAGQGDIVASLSDPLPALTVCYLLGLPPEDTSRLIPLVADVSLMLDGVTDIDGMGRAGTAALELSEYARTHLDAARDRPSAERSGLLAVLVDAIESQVLADYEAVPLLLQFFTAGTETTSSLIANATETLARQADLQERLRRHPERIPEALEDILRDDGPFQFHYRWTTTDTSLKDVPIPANSRVLLLWAAANRPSPQEPGSAHHDVDDADPGAHFAFGRGLHFCIGAPLARLESRIAIERLLSQTSCISLDPDHPPVRRPSILLRRHASLPVILTGGR